MTYSIYRGSRSMRLTVRTPDGVTVVAENLDGDNGPAMSFSARRTMDDSPGEYTVTAWNLPPAAVSAIKYGGVRKPDDLDSILSGLVLQTAALPTDGAAALTAGYLIVEVEAGYDGTLGRVYRSIGSRVRSRRPEGDLDDETTIASVEDLDGALLGLPTAVFPAGATTFELVDYLRRIAGIGPGNLNQANWAAILGDSRLSSPYHCGGGQALSRLRSVLQYMPLRWFIDDREFWVCGRDDMPNFGSVPAYVADEVGEPDLLLRRPERVDGGYVQVECLLCPRLRVGRLVRLTEAGLAAPLQGLSPDAVQEALADVPPGLYRLDSLEHRGSTFGGDWTSTLSLRPGVAVAP